MFVNLQNVLSIFMFFVLDDRASRIMLQLKSQFSKVMSIALETSIILRPHKALRVFAVFPYVAAADAVVGSRPKNAKATVLVSYRMRLISGYLWPSRRIAILLRHVLAVYSSSAAVKMKSLVPPPAETIRR
ncbi:hypothetical protein V9T40_005889 [Parthenolecanium corni]|uniref:Uncharacterized protein n=1 Tax=Parthenolecanium corni TaxID=536013 RepID=A0AAN9U415_9HEMI